MTIEFAIKLRLKTYDAQKYSFNSLIFFKYTISQNKINLVIRLNLTTRPALILQPNHH